MYAHALQNSHIHAKCKYEFNYEKDLIMFHDKSGLVVHSAVAGTLDQIHSN